jgi:hypothetical protein
MDALAEGAIPPGARRAIFALSLEEPDPMKPVLRSIPLALILAASCPSPSLADSDEECRKMAAEEEVAAEDLEDYLAECMAVIDSDSPDAAASEAPADGEDAPAGEEEGR